MNRKNSGNFHERLWLLIRNTFTVLASLLFLISILFNHSSGVLKFVAYICGMLAYACEFVFLTKGFKQKVPHDEMFMIYCFAPLYLLLGISYLLH